jgi:hypothetical protein
MPGTITHCMLRVPNITSEVIDHTGVATDNPEIVTDPTGYASVAWPYTA